MSHPAAQPLTHAHTLSCSFGCAGTFTFYSDSTVYFPGRVTAVPADRPAPDDGINLALVVGMPIVACIALLISGYAFYYRFKASKLQGKLQKLQDNLVGTRAVLADFDPRTLPPPIRGATGATSAAMAPAAPYAPALKVRPPPAPQPAKAPVGAATRVTSTVAAHLQPSATVVSDAANLEECLGGGLAVGLGRGAEGRVGG